MQVPDNGVPPTTFYNAEEVIHAIHHGTVDALVVTVSFFTSITV
jgi:hypothetical protein